jgi:UPF0755 protein
MTIGGRNGGPRDDGAPGIRTGSIAGTTAAGAAYRSRRGPATWRGVIVILILAALVIAGIAYLLAPAFRDFAGSMARSNPQSMRLPFVGDVVRDQLGTALTQAASTDATPVPFDIQPGSSVGQIADGLTTAGLIHEPLVFQYLVVTQNLDGKLQTGSFTLNKTMTPQAIVDRLQRPPDPAPAKTVVDLRPGLRIEQIVALLQTLPLEMDVQQFRDLALHPPTSLLADYPFLKVLPRGASVEGFLGDGAFDVDPAISAEDFLRELLTAWSNQVGKSVTDQVDKLGNAKFYDAMVLASIVEKETGDDAERAKIAGVYTNRLNHSLYPTQLLNADPTVIFAVDTDNLRNLPFDQWSKYVFWTTTGQNLNTLDVPSDLQSYQTYRNPGLPDGPIASPSLPSIKAALAPDTKGGYLYFYACPATQVTKFAKTFAQQQQNIASCK